ncbi:MAG: hypothetical protein ACUVQ7_03895 [bacterium]
MRLKHSFSMFMKVVRCYDEGYVIRVSMIDDSVVPGSNGFGLSSKYPEK